MVDVYKSATAHNADRMVRNNAGGRTYKVHPLDRLERFLILGTVGGTFYVSERKITEDNIKAVQQIILEFGAAAVDKIIEIGTSNRAPKHDPALVAFALAVSCGNPEIKAYALSQFNKIIRTGTHLFHFVTYIDGRVGWGRSLRRAVGKWYTEKDDKTLAYQLMKYKQRDGWSHRDVLRLAHPQATTPSQNAILKYTTQGTLDAMDNDAHRFIEACIEVSQMTDVDEITKLIREYNLPREVLPTQAMNDARTWEALAPSMGLTALLRNLRNMHKDGYLVQGSDAVRTVRERLTDAEGLRRARIHPAHVFMAKKNAADIPASIQTALEDAFFETFKNVEPTNKRLCLALDVSASMNSPAYSGGGFSHYGAVRGPIPPSAREWSALQAMVTARVEPYAEFVAFSHTIVPIDITPRDSLDDVIHKMSAIPMGGTDCAAPMIYARDKGLKFDGFAVYTDNETWYGDMVRNWGMGYGARNSGSGNGTPMEALRSYREKSSIHDAALCVVGITATEFTIADPDDLRTLDIVGFDADAPAVMADFFRN